MKLILLLVCLSTMLDGTFAQNCAKTPCDQHAKCEIRNGIEGCYCVAGFTGNGITICKDDNECENSTQPCGENANCTNTEGSYFCMCAPGFTSSSSQNKFVTNDGTICIENVKANCHLDDVCIAANINKTLIEIKHQKELRNLLQEIYQNSEQVLFPIDVLTNVEALSASSPSLSYMNSNVSEKEAFTNTTINVFVNTINNLVQKDKITVWDKLSADNRRTSLTKLMHTAEQTMLSMSQNFKKTTQLEINSSDMGLKLFAFDSHHMKHIHPHMNIEGNHIKIYPRRKDEYDSNGTIAVVFLCYKSIGALLSSSESASQETENYESPEQEEIVISSIVSVSISAKPTALYQLEKITFTLSHVKPREKSSIKCAFWNYSSDTLNGSWSTEGCELMHSNSTHTSCKCNHLTHFAILMSSGVSIGIKDYNILTRITQLGIIISLVCLAMCIFTFWFFSEIQSTRTTIHKNLCCSLFLAELVFLVGINTNSNKLFCSIIAGLLHYFFLAAFAWMCIEGIHLYLIVVGVIYNKGFLHKNFYIFGYLSPAVVVGFSASLGYRYYGTTKVCWLSTENNFIWSFIGPACLIILVNLLAFGVIIYKVFRHTAMLKPEVSCYENIRSCARGALALLFLLGTTWIFGVLHVVHASVVTAYLFTISNAFQGMFIFIFLCVLSRKIQEEYYRLFKNVPCCSGCLR
ncbi:adhesion G protein-coupled receptor L4 [Gracilinanus agilis]|uniref:adhesion G protein-coupled receptor L4 n=1 Tax=Gracilinanus agilis TaxID=191870 RepID=UPI001CFD5122|nr:adhesion G protein-coupled receptor L4 [Gracilinanus agilis]